MAALLQSWTRKEIRAVVRFLNAKAVAPVEIHRQLVEVYGDSVMTKKQVYVWCNNFNAGRCSVADEQRSGRPLSSQTDVNIEAVDRLIRRDKRMKIRDVAEELDISKSTAHRIVYDVLKYRKVCARWVPKQLTEDHKSTRMAFSLQNLQRYKTEDEFLTRIVTGDETWVHYVTPETKRDSMIWKHVGSPPPKKFKTVLSAKKVLATVFWDRLGVLLVDFLPRGNTVNVEQYC
jgi:hypothetical protein